MRATHVEICLTNFLGPFDQVCAISTTGDSIFNRSRSLENVIHSVLFSLLLGLTAIEHVEVTDEDNSTFFSAKHFHLAFAI